MKSFENQIDSNSSTQNINNLNICKLNFKDNIKETKDLKNSRIEQTLSLRKKKMNDYLTEKRKKQMNQIKDDDVYINIEMAKLSIPAMLLTEFDVYDEKLSLIHQFFNDDFSSLKGTEFNSDSVKLYSLYQLIKLSFEENDQIFNERFQKNLTEVFLDIIKIINESKSKKVLFGCTAALANILYVSSILSEEIRKINGIWKRFQEISELKNSELNDNILKIMTNIYVNIPNVGKEYILSNYSRYTKQIFSNFLKQFFNESNSDKINLDLFDSGFILIKRLIKNENSDVKKENDIDVVVKLKYLYSDLTKIFITFISWIINGINIEINPKIYNSILILLQIFTSIAKYGNEDTYEMKEFQDDYFVTSFCSLLRIFILNKNKELETEITLKVLNEIYSFLSILFSFNSEITEIYCKNKIIILTEELIKIIGLNDEELFYQIIFFLSNYGENPKRCSDIFRNNTLLISIKEYANKIINDQSKSNNLFFLIENGFNTGDINCKEIIINDFTYFIKERIKVLSDLTNNDKYASHFNKKCQLLLAFLMFLENNIGKYSKIIDNIIFFLQRDNFEEYLIKVQTNSKNYNQEIIGCLLSKLKTKPKEI